MWGIHIKRKPSLLKTIAKHHLDRIESYAVKSEVAHNMAAMVYRSKWYSFMEWSLRSRNRGSAVRCSQYPVAATVYSRSLRGY